MTAKTKIIIALSVLLIFTVAARLLESDQGNQPFASLMAIIAIILLTAILYFTVRQDTAATSISDQWHIDANSLLDAIFVTDLNGKVKGTNRACRDLLPETHNSSTAAQLMEPLHDQLNDRFAADDVVSAVLAAPEIKFSDRLTLNNGRVIERTTRPIENSSERIWILSDITQATIANSDSEMHQTMVEEDAARTAELAEQLFHAKAELEEKQTELTRLANTDPMTGLLNRRRFLARADEAILETQAENSLWVIMMDIDHFKRVNDTYGHAAGDVAIRDFAGVIRNCINTRGFIGRMGGEEFAAILTNCPVDEAYRIAERIRRNTAQMQTVSGSEVFRFTTSIGVAPWISGEISIEPALDRADKALYSAKSFGRNRVVGYE